MKQAKTQSKVMSFDDYWNRYYNTPLEQIFKEGAKAERERVLKIIKKFIKSNKDYDEGWEIGLIKEIKEKK